MDELKRIRELSDALHEHQRHHAGGACYAPSEGICPAPEWHREIAREWKRLAETNPKKFGWAKFRDRIATHLPCGRWENEIPTIGWGKCESCGNIGPVFYLAGGRETCIRCLEEAP